MNLSTRKVVHITMNTNKSTPIDLADYAKHTIDCDARYFYIKNDKVDEDSYGECNCGLFDLLDALGLRKKDMQEYY